jgi:hypothetical protein
MVVAAEQVVILQRAVMAVDVLQALEEQLVALQA